MNEKWRPTLLSGSKSSTFCRRRMNQKYRKAGKTFLRLKVQSLNFKPSMMSNCMNEKWIKCPPCQSLAPASLYESPLRAGSGLHTQYDSLLFCFHQTLLQISLPQFEHCFASAAPHLPLDLMAGKLFAAQCAVVHRPEG